MEGHLSTDHNQRVLVHQFIQLNDWTSRYHHVVAMGEALPPFPDRWRRSVNRVSGCASLLWLRGLGEADCVVFRGASDCPMDAGLLAMALQVYSGQPARAIVASPPLFIAALGLPQRFSMGRLQGLERIVNHMRQFALQRLLDARVPVQLEPQPALRHRA